MKLTKLTQTLFFLLAPGASASIILDANYTPSTTNGALVVRNDLSDAQTFTIQNSGSLTSISLLLSTSQHTNALPISVDIRTLNGSSPTEPNSGSNVLFSGFILYSAVTQLSSFVSVPLPNLSVASGDKLAVVLSTADISGYLWYADLNFPAFGSGPGTYPGGQAFDRGPSATLPNGSGYTVGSATWATLFLYNSPGITGGGPNADFGFQAYVSTPEPSTWLSIASGGGILAWVRRRRFAAV